MPENNSSQHLKIKVADWKTDSIDLKAIRLKVFVEEQNVPLELEWDEYDESSVHFLATLNGKVVAVARLKTDGQIGRMAVLREYRNQGIGSRLLQFILQYATQNNIDNIYLHAQVTAIPFYENNNFIATGETFYDANIAHRTMLKKVC